MANPPGPAVRPGTAATAGSGALQSYMDELPTDRLKAELGSYLAVLAQRRALQRRKAAGVDELQTFQRQ